MTIDPAEVSRAIVETKRRLRLQLPPRSEVCAEVEDFIRRETDFIRNRHARGERIVPELEYKDIAAGRVPESATREVRRRGCAVVRRVFPRAQAEEWDQELGHYIAEKTGVEAESAPDRYFSALESGRPQIFGVYWSRPQIAARQSESLARTRAYLNNLWISRRGDEIYFDPSRECTYADRIRRREPGDATLGLSPHIDAGSIERWIDPAYRRVYRRVLAGDWRSYDPFDGAARGETEEIPSPAVCSMFRTYQGWTALTEQGPGDGTLQLIPIAAGVAYLLLRAIQDDVPEDDLCGAEPGRALSVTREWHAPLLEGLCPIPLVEPGDTVWWHPDVAHAVEDRHGGRGYSDVIYIGAAPYCPKNAAYLVRQREAFLRGESAPDFAAEHREINHPDRATPADLTELGRRQMGMLDW
jgi:hypothetical protein